jgi:polyhydroxybutyrate depolymerase
MKNILYGLLILVSFNAYTHAQQTINGTIMHNGILRSYILYVPAIYSSSTAVPLLFNFHGYTSNASQQLVYGDFRPIADTANMIIVHPEGTLDVNGNTHFNVGWGGSAADDVGFTEALIDSISSTYSIDQSRIYAVGMSNGGFMSLLLACTLSERIAAVGSVTGSMTPSMISSCNLTHSMPVIQIHGTSDATVPYNGIAGFSSSVENVLDYWVSLNTCNPSPVVENVPNSNVNDGSTVEKYTYENGDNCSEVVHYKVIDGGHTWPGSLIVLAGTNLDFKATKEIWNFVRNYTLTGLIGCNGASISDEVYTLVRSGTTSHGETSIDVI